MVMNCRRRLRIQRSRHRSIYRDILFLALVACGRENIDCGKNTLFTKFFYETDLARVNKCGIKVLIEESVAMLFFRSKFQIVLNYPQSPNCHKVMDETWSCIVSL